MRHRPFSICETKVNSAPTFCASWRWDSPRLSRSSRSQRPALARSSRVDVSDCCRVWAYMLPPSIVGAPKSPPASEEAEIVDRDGVGSDAVDTQQQDRVDPDGDLGVGSEVGDGDLAGEIAGVDP